MRFTLLGWLAVLAVLLLGAALASMLAWQSQMPEEDAS